MIVFGVNFENVYKELSGYSAIIILTNGPRSCKFFEEKFEKKKIMWVDILSMNYKIVA